MELPRFAELLARQLEGILELSPAQTALLYSHFELLLRWNQRMNLTSLRSAEEIVTRHYCESVFFGKHLPGASEGARILDLGSGAGFPGVPMAVLRSDWRLTLLEAHRRKAVFLRESTRGLHNVKVEAIRAEAVPGRFDWVVSRAVGVKQVIRQVPRLSSRVGLLVTESDVGELHRHAEVEWSEPISMPWGTQRLCVYGNCST